MDIPFYYADLIKLNASKASSKNRDLFPFGKPFPCLKDRFTQSGEAKGHYFHQDLLVARRIFANNPKLHVDIGSRIDGFVAHVATFRLIEIIDIRPLSSTIPNVKFIQADLMDNMDEKLINYCDSLSSLHALEHFGLGRYGDPVNYDGYLDGLTNMSTILQTGGKFYFSVPIGPQRIEFNAHRVFSIDYLMELFNGKYRIDKFSFIDDKGDEKTYIYLKDDSTMEIGGSSDNMVRYSELQSAYNQLKSDFDNLVNSYNTHIHVTTATVGATAVPGVLLPTTATETPSSGDISGAKIEEIKTL